MIVSEVSKKIGQSPRSTNLYQFLMQPGKGARLLPKTMMGHSRIGPPPLGSANE